jgi:hypothetical protein
VPAVTDEDREFRLGVDTDALYLLVKAPFLAPEQTQLLAAGPMTHTITLGSGATHRYPDSPISTPQSIVFSWRGRALNLSVTS